MTVKIAVTCADCGKTREIAKTGHPTPERCKKCSTKREQMRMLKRA